MAEEKCDNILEVAARIAGRADEIDEVLVLYTVKNARGYVRHGSISNGLTISDAIFLIETFKFWMLDKANKPQT